jgi:hypothetical protein
MSTFDSTKRFLPEILSDILKAKIQLPDFQRGWVSPLSHYLWRAATGEERRGGVAAGEL